MKRRVAISAAAVAALAGTAVGQQVKISQVYGGGGNTGAPYNRDFVELFNAGAAPVDVTGWSIQYAAATGTTWSKTDLTPAIIPPGGYYLAQMTLTGTTGSPLPTPDHIVGTGILMSATAGKVALVSNTTTLAGGCPTGPQIIDFVGFGTTANCFEGTGPTGAPANATAVLRDDNGCDDTADNATNFTVGAPNPRNLASPANICPQPPGADMGVGIAAVGQVNLNGALTYTVTLNNFGPDTATGVQLVMPVPAGTTFTSSVPANAPVGGVLTFNLADITLGGSDVVSVTVSADAGPSIAATVTVSAAQADPVGSNNSAGTSTLVYNQAAANVIIGAETAGVGVYAVDPTSGATEQLFSGEVAALASDDASRRFFFSTGPELWTVPYDAPRTPVLVGAFDGPISTLSGGLAWDSTRGILYGTTTSNIYRIDPATAVATLVRAIGAGDFAGLDYDPTIDRLIATNDSTSTTNGLTGRGLYRIDPLGTEVVEFSEFPIETGSTAETDIDGCAVGGGFVYAVTDERQWFYRYNQGSSAFEPNIPNPWTVDEGNSGATYTTEVFAQSPGTNLGVVITAPADCTVVQGGILTYTVTVHNYGPDGASLADLTVPVPAGTSFVSSVPPVVPSGGNLLLEDLTLSPGQDQVFTVTVSPLAGGDVTLSASVADPALDPFPVNNSAQRDVAVFGAPPATAAAVGIFSTVAGSNEVPEHPGIFFDDALDMDRPVRSYSGTHWLMGANTTDAATQDDVLLRGSGVSFSVEVQENVTPLPTAEPVGLFDIVYGINDAGEYSFGTNLAGEELADEVIVKYAGGAFTIVAREGSLTPSGLAVWGTTSNGATIQNDGTVSFQSSLNTDLLNDGWFTDDANTLIAQEGVTVPGNQAGGATDAYRQLDSGSAAGQGFFLSADGQHSCGRGAVGPADTDDLVLVVDGNVVLQEGSVVPGSGFPSPISATGIVMNFMEPHGDWFAYGSNADGDDWVVRNGTVLAATGQEVFPGAGVNWDDAAFAQGFFIATGNRFGDYVVAGLTTAGSTISDAMMVFNGSRIALRENDPIDLDADGVFDDDAYIHIFRNNFTWLGEDGYLYSAVRLRNAAGICSGSPADTGQAFIRVRVFCPADWNRNGATNSTDISAFLTSWLASVQGGNPVRADFNGDTAANSTDISAFLTAWLAAVQGGC